MAAIDIITRYFPQLTPEQIEHFTQLDTLYRDWNAKINVISRKDIVRSMSTIYSTRSASPR